MLLKPAPPWLMLLASAWLNVCRNVSQFECSLASCSASVSMRKSSRTGRPVSSDHSADEWLDLASVVPRTTLLATLIARVGEAL